MLFRSLSINNNTTGATVTGSVLTGSGEGNNLGAENYVAPASYDHSAAEAHTVTDTGHGHTGSASSVSGGATNGHMPPHLAVGMFICSRIVVKTS